MISYAEQFEKPAMRSHKAKMQSQFGSQTPRSRWTSTYLAPIKKSVLAHQTIIAQDQGLNLQSREAASVLNRFFYQFLGIP